MSVPLLDPGRIGIIVLSVVAWAAWSAVCGYVAHRLPARAVDRDTWLTRLRPVEGGGRLYERWGIKRWKDRLPEAGALFAGGFSKRSLRDTDPAVMERFVAETRRAEYTHWAILALGPVFLVLLVWYAALVNLVYALVANVPFIAIQRYNRARFLRVLARLSRP